MVTLTQPPFHRTVPLGKDQGLFSYRSSLVLVNTAVCVATAYSPSPDSVPRSPLFQLEEESGQLGRALLRHRQGSRPLELASTSNTVRLNHLFQIYILSVYQPPKTTGRDGGLADCHHQHRGEGVPDPAAAPPPPPGLPPRQDRPRRHHRAGLFVVWYYHHQQDVANSD